MTSPGVVPCPDSPAGEFTDPIHVQLDMDTGRFFLLTRPVVYYTTLAPPEEHPSVSPMGDGRYRIRIPAGLLTDFASTPRWAWSVAPPIGRHSAAAALHDYLYVDGIGDRLWADKVFLEAMEVSGSSSWIKVLYYSQVRWWGWWAWNHHVRRRKKEAEAKASQEGAH